MAGFELAESTEGVVNIKVIGTGGGGCNAVNRMIASGTKGVEFIAVNTDRPVIDISRADKKIQIGAKLTKGQGAGSDPKIGEDSALESREEIEELLRGTDMVFIAAGMGGGTGTGSAPVIAKIAKDLGILTVAIVTKPFNFEGRQKMRVAEAGIAKLRENVDSLIIIPNEKLKEASTERITLLNAFQIADDVLRQGVQSISDLILIPGLVNLDFADVYKVMKDAGNAHMGVGRASGKDKAETAAQMAISSPLLETTIEGATGVIINITGSPDIGLDEVDIAAQKITESVHPDANIIWGAAFNNDLDDEMIITVIATGFDSAKPDVTIPESTISQAPATSPAAPVKTEPTPAPAPTTVPDNIFVTTPDPEPETASSNSDSDSDYDFNDIFTFFHKKSDDNED